MTTPCLAIVFFAALAGNAIADTPQVNPEAQRHVEAGTTAYQVHDYATASREYEAAYSLDPDPKVLYAWAQSLRFDNRCTEALPLYRRFLETKMGDSVRKEVEKLIAGCEPTKPFPDPVPDPKPDPKPDPRPDPPPIREAEPSRWYRDPLGAALVIGGAAAIGTGVGFFVLSSRSEDAANRAVLREDFVELLDEATTRRRIGYVGVGVGGALVAGGIVRYVTRGNRSARVSITTTGTSILAFGRF